MNATPFLLLLLLILQPPFHSIDIDETDLGEKVKIDDPVKSHQDRFAEEVLTLGLFSIISI